MTSVSRENILGAVGILCLLAWVARDMPPTIRRESGKTTIRYAFWVRCFYLFSAFALPLALTLWAIVNRPEEGEMWCLLASYALFAFLTGPVWWMVTRFALTISDEGLECHSPWRRTRFVKWSEIEEVTFGEMGRWYVLRAVDGYRFRVPQQAVPGLGDFLAAVGRHRPELLRGCLRPCGTSHLWEVLEGAEKPQAPPPAEQQ
jgi:hypothetical protein